MDFFELINYFFIYFKNHFVCFNGYNRFNCPNSYSRLDDNDNIMDRIL
jgi:hypothetical protein